VSPLWRDELGIFLGPHKLSIARLRRGVRPKPAGETGWINERRGDVGWNATLTALDALLGKSEWQGAVARIVLSDQWVRYAAVPYSNELSNRSERIAHARQVLLNIYGEIVAQWSVSLADTPPGAIQIACALPTLLVEELQTVLARHNVPMQSLQPQLVAAYNHWRGELPSGGAWFVSIEQGTLAAARLTPRGWDRVHSVRIGADWATELRRLQTFGRLAGNSADDGRVYVDAPAAVRLSAGNAGDNLHWLDESRPVDSTAGRLEYFRRHSA
jgi:hypothetical protein